MKSRLENDMSETLQDQFATLSDEVIALRKQIKRQSRGAINEAMSVSEDATNWLREQASSALPEIKRGARRLQRSAHDNPNATIGVAVAGLFLVGMAVALMTRR